MRRSVVMGVTAWLAVVVVASGVTWAVINAAGQTVLSGEEASLTALPSPSVVGPGVGTSPSARPQPSSTSAPAGTATPGSSATGRTGPPRTSGPTGEPVYTERAWQGRPGAVLARCTGATIALRSATPNDGYHIEVGSSGPQELEVKFESSTGNEFKVKGECMNGVPRFQTEAEPSEDED